MKNFLRNIDLMLIFGFRNLLEPKDRGIELDGAIQIRNGQSDGVHTAHQRVWSGDEQSAAQEQCTEEAAQHHDNLSIK